MDSLNRLIAYGTNYVGLTWLEVGLRVFLTTSVVLAILWIIPFTKSIAQNLLGHKYRLTWLFMASFFKTLWYQVCIIFKHLFTDKKEIYRTLKTDLADDEDRIRGR